MAWTVSSLPDRHASIAIIALSHFPVSSADAVRVQVHKTQRTRAAYAHPDRSQGQDPSHSAHGGLPGVQNGRGARRADGREADLTSSCMVPAHGAVEDTEPVSGARQLSMRAAG